jgi:hypothetical protein
MSWISLHVSYTSVLLYSYKSSQEILERTGAALPGAGMSVADGGISAGGSIRAKIRSVRGRGWHPPVRSRLWHDRAFEICVLEAAPP